MTKKQPDKLERFEVGEKIDVPEWLLGFSPDEMAELLDAVGYEVSSVDMEKGEITLRRLEPKR